MAPRKKVIEKVEEIIDINLEKTNSVEIKEDELILIKTKIEELSRECKVVMVNKDLLTVKFGDYLLPIKTTNVDTKVGDFVTIKYQSEIGKPDFRYQI